MPRHPDIQLNLNVRGMGASATVAINERCNQLRSEGREVFKLGLGQSPFPVPQQVVASLQQHAGEKDYLPVCGLPRLRQAVADYHCRRDGLQSRAEDVLVGPGSKELMFLLQLVYYGDLVIPTPAWVSYAPQAKIIGRQVRLIETQADQGWRLSATGLETLCKEDPDRPRVLILNYPANPTGGTYGLDELEALAEVARKYKVVLLSDEIYGELHHEAQHVSISRYYPEGTIISSGLSKWCGAGGWRLGTFLFPSTMHWLLNAMAAAASETYTSTSAPIQYAAVTAFEGSPEIDDYLVLSRRILAALGGWACEQLRASGIACGSPQGAFYLFPNFQPHADKLSAMGISTSAALCEELLTQTGVAILPGSDFGRPDAELTARLAYVDFDGRSALKAAEALGEEPLGEDFVAQYCPRMKLAIERICSWVANGG